MTAAERRGGRKAGAGGAPDAVKRRRSAKRGAVLCWILGFAGLAVSFAGGEKQSNVRFHCFMFFRIGFI